MSLHFLPKMPEGSPLEWQRRGLILGSTETLPSIYAMNQQKPKWKPTWLIYAAQFYVTDVNYISSNAHLKGQPCSSTSHHQCRLQCHSSTLHPRQFRFKTDLGEVYMEVSCFPGSLKQLPVASDKSRVSTEAGAQVQVLEREEKGGQGLRLPFQQVLAITSA